MRTRGHCRVTHRPPNPSSMRGLQQALAALYADAPVRSSEELLAERARLHAEAEARVRAQGVLPLRLRDEQ